jgi:DNA-binding NtrC family response regulator
MRVLVVDDEAGFRDHLGAGLSRQGHEVGVAATGREAIDLGIRFRPNVLVTDWMLCNPLNGLHVAHALHAVDPTLPAILMTGFPSSDLRVDARNMGVLQFIEKPFDLKALVAAVERAGSQSSSARPAAAIGVLEVDADGRLRSTNARARDLLSGTIAGRDARNWCDVFGIADEDARQLLARCGEDWISIVPEATRSKRWWGRARPAGDRTIVVLLSEDQRSLRQDSRVQLLLDVSSESTVSWPSSDRALVIDADSTIRSLFVRQLERAGCVCYKAETEELALRLFRSDSEIRVVVVDYDMPAASLGELVAELRGTRADVKIVGHSATPLHKLYFSALGVKRFLTKPWGVTDLIDVLA